MIAQKPESFRPRAEECAAFSKGQMLWRGVVKSREEMWRLREHFNGYGQRDWFIPYSKDFTAMIDRVIAEHDDYWREQG